MQPTQNSSSPVIISGKLDIYQAGVLRDELARQIDANPDATLDLAQVTACDAIGLQLLWSAKRYAEREAKPFSVRGATEDVLDTCRQLGLPFDELSPSTGVGQ